MQKAIFSTVFHKKEHPQKNWKQKGKI
jgi:hypothetical protein